MLLEIDETFMNAWNIISPIAWKIFGAIVCFIIGKKVINWAEKLIVNAAKKGNLDKGITSFLISLGKFILYVILIIVIAGFLGVPTASFVAILGSCGLAIGLALQGSLQNFAGGVLILIMKPFSVGDYVVVNGLEGTVSSIDVCYTTLKTVDNKTVVMPNGALSNSNIVNVSKESTRRVDIIVPISYDDNIKAVKDMLQNIAVGEELVLKNRGIDIYVNEFGSSSINLGFRVWVKAENYWTVKWSMLETIKNEMDKNGFTIPFNQMDVHIENNDK